MVPCPNREVMKYIKGLNGIKKSAFWNQNFFDVVVGEGPVAIDIEDIDVVLDWVRLHRPHRVREVADLKVPTDPNVFLKFGTLLLASLI